MTTSVQIDPIAQVSIHPVAGFLPLVAAPFAFLSLVASWPHEASERVTDAHQVRSDQWNDK